LLLVGSLDVVEESLVVLADERFGVVAGDVVPFDTVLVQVVQDSKAGLRGLVDVELGIVGLWCLGVAGLRPGHEGPARGLFVGGRDLLVRGGPEPAVEVDGVEVSPGRAAVKVTQASRGPDVCDVAVFNEFLHHLVFGGGFHGNSVHAACTAVVTRFQPVHLLAGSLGLDIAVTAGLEADLPCLVVPGEVVPLSRELPLLVSVTALLVDG